MNANELVATDGSSNLTSATALSTWFKGTTNQITVTDNTSNGTTTLSLPQNIHTGATPQFAGMTLTGGVTLPAVATLSAATSTTISTPWITAYSATNPWIGSTVADDNRRSIRFGVDTTNSKTYVTSTFGNVAAFPLEIRMVNTAQVSLPTTGGVNIGAVTTASSTGQLGLTRLYLNATACLDGANAGRIAVTGTVDAITMTSGGAISGTGTISPAANGTSDLGASNLQWHYLNVIAVRNTAATGNAAVYIEADCTDGSSNAYVNFFRSTNTTGAKLISLLKGDGTNTTMATIRADAPSFYPATTNTGTLGTSSLYWQYLYAGRVYVNSTAYLDGGTAGHVGITGALDVTGQACIAGQVLGPAGSAAVPSFANLNDTDTGWYFPATGKQGWVVNGTENMRLTSTGLKVGTSGPADPNAAVDVHSASDHGLRSTMDASDTGHYCEVLAIHNTSAVASAYAVPLPGTAEDPSQGFGSGYAWGMQWNWSSPPNTGGNPYYPWACYAVMTDPATNFDAALEWVFDPIGQRAVGANPVTAMTLTNEGVLSVYGCHVICDHDHALRSLFSDDNTGHYCEVMAIHETTGTPSSYTLPLPGKVEDPSQGFGAGYAWGVKWDSWTSETVPAVMDINEPYYYPWACYSAITNPTTADAALLWVFDPWGQLGSEKNPYTAMTLTSQGILSVYGCYVICDHDHALRSTFSDSDTGHYCEVMAIHETTGTPASYTLPLPGAVEDPSLGFGAGYAWGVKWDSWTDQTIPRVMDSNEPYYYPWACYSAITNPTTADAALLWVFDPWGQLGQGSSPYTAMTLTHDGDLSVVSLAAESISVTGNSSLQSGSGHMMNPTDGWLKVNVNGSLYYIPMYQNVV